MTNLLATKFHLPSPPPRPIQRPHLIQSLNLGFDQNRRMTLVSAPAGFGKTSCIREWIAGLHLPVCWLSLDPADDDPGRFFTYLIAGLQRVDETLGHEIQGVLQAAQLPPAEVIMTSLINDMDRIQGRFLLVLDDFHVIQDPTIIRVFDELILHFPESIHLVLLTREDPVLPLARLRANNQLTEIRAEDLRFSRTETDQFLQEVMDLRLSEADLTRLDERTEGWVVGLQLAGLSLQGNPEPSKYITHLSGSQRNILNYLTEEVLNRQPEDIQEFLLQTSILEKLNGDLCDAITNRTDSTILLERLYNANLFLIPLDDELRWYRYHHLFANMLQGRQKALRKEDAAALHQRAAQWYQAASLPALPLDERTTYICEAIEHALSAEDFGVAVQMIEQHALDLVMQWYSKRVSAWIQALPHEWSIQSPRINLAFAWTHLLQGNPFLASPYLDQLQMIFAERNHKGDPSLQAEWLALHATLGIAKGRAIEGLELARQALAIVPEGEGKVRSQIFMAIASAYKQLDDYPRAVEAYQSLIHHGRAGRNIIFELIGISGLALMLVERGQLRLGYDLATQGMQRAAQMGVMSPICAGIFGELGQIHYHWHELDQALTCFRRAEQVSAISGFSDAEIFFTVARSRIALLRGDLTTAHHEISKAVDHMQVEAPVVVREEVIHQQVRVLLAGHQLAAAEAAVAGAGHGEKAFAGPSHHLASRTLADLETREDISYPQGMLANSVLRILLYKALNQGDPAHLDQALRLADGLVAAFLKRSYLPIVLETLLLRSQVYDALGDEPSSTAGILQALVMAEPEGFISVFLEGGIPVAEKLTGLLEDHRLGTVQPAYIKSILAAFPTWQLAVQVKPRPPANTGLVEPLTERELEVLGLMAGGSTYNEMAEKLVVSINTIRTHIKSIYGKLGVNNRTAAIEAARQAEIL